MIWRWSLPTVRYIVTDINAAVNFYVNHFGFCMFRRHDEVAMLFRGRFQLLLSSPKHFPNSLDKGQPPHGGSNRFQVAVRDLSIATARLRAAGVKVRDGVFNFPDGSIAICEDPSGNIVELYQSKMRLANTGRVVRSRRQVRPPLNNQAMK